MASPAILTSPQAYGQVAVLSSSNPACIPKVGTEACTGSLYLQPQICFHVMKA
ncbi:hypothetical protein AMATHDRAFT_59256 [Amanita thiersii Skay4041]|uniref:Uncharacterized protein n=1 Tax=Amanita thiersii Skay4041 TaxID=703135 RepID=A0A2A9NL37_9AGAR|nr:hypothetical protein AMATHDRAFT_59256 [Amanita thiersii Skay4041]